MLKIHYNQASLSFHTSILKLCRTLRWSGTLVKRRATQLHAGRQFAVIETTNALACSGVSKSICTSRLPLPVTAQTRPGGFNRAFFFGNGGFGQFPLFPWNLNISSPVGIGSPQIVHFCVSVILSSPLKKPAQPGGEE